MARRVRLVRNPEHAGHLPYDEWIPAHAVKFNSADGTTSVMTESRHNRGRRNIAAGFFDAEGDFGPAGGWHPIRASYDYSPKRGGDKPPKRRKKAKAKAKPKAKRKRR